MTRRALLVSDAATGDGRWARLARTAGWYADLGFEIAALRLGEANPGAPAVRRWREALRAEIACARPDAAPAALARLDDAAAFDVIHLDAPSAPPWIAAGRRGFRVAERPAALAAEGALPGWAEHVDAFLAVVPDDEAAIETTGRPGFAAAFLGRFAPRPAPLRRRRAPGPRLAGLWLDGDEGPQAAAAALLDAVRRRGGGAPPRFLIGGPAAASLDPPPLPHPAVVVDAPRAARVFHRGLDLSLFPEAGGVDERRRACGPRVDLLEALEAGATPIASSAALHGLGRFWRLPRFDDLEAFAEYLFERGRDLRDGGLSAELRARADWTWAGLRDASATQGAALAAAIRERLREKAPR
ncbi:MAG: hypothetical protein AAGF90_06025, partial [Pseudomonadota bacterium]